jgi:class 3 adenylate cyclase
MSLNKDITKRVKEIIETTFSIEEADYVPELNDSRLSFGNTGIKFEATVLYIDMRESTRILNNHNKGTIAKIHMAYLYTVVKIAKTLGGEVRSFNGDSVLAFFEGTTKESLNSAVEAALKIQYMISNDESGINNLLKKYSAVDFGIGLDDGKILCTKIGIGGDNNTKDLIWVGNAINKSVIISDKCRAAEYIGISNYVYTNLEHHNKFGITKGPFGRDMEVEIWKPYQITYNNKLETFYKTSWYIPVE